MDAAGAIASTLPVLITLYWFLATFAALVAIVPLPCSSTFRNAVLLSACRGKLMDTRPNASLGFLTDWTVPQRWFFHFYAMGAIWNALVASSFAIFPGSRSNTSLSEFALHLWALIFFEVHLIRRLLETLFLMKYPEGARMHGIAWLFGLSYYLVMPLTLVPRHWYGLIASDISSEKLFNKEIALITLPSLQEAMSSWTNYSGLGIVLVGTLLQFHSHYLLAQPWQKRRRTAPASISYRIPRGGGFEWVSCPHYLAEILVYVGFAVLLVEYSVWPWLPVAWVFANLTLAAGLTHGWYLHKFKTYPRHRKALIPYIY